MLIEKKINDKEYVDTNFHRKKIVKKSKLVFECDWHKIGL